jgi:hypothetical protein
MDDTRFRSDRGGDQPYPAEEEYQDSDSSQQVRPALPYRSGLKQHRGEVRAVNLLVIHRAKPEHLCQIANVLSVCEQYFNLMVHDFVENGQELLPSAASKTPFNSSAP